MAKNEQVETPRPLRKIVPPLRDAMNIPAEAADTYDAPPKGDIGPDNENSGAVVAAFNVENVPTDASGKATAAPIQQIPQTPIFTGGERVVWVKPNKSFKTYIGDRWYSFEKNVPQRVTETVRHILGKAGKIYP